MRMGKNPTTFGKKPHSTRATWGAAIRAMIKKQTMWIQPRLGAIQPCQLRRAAPSRSLAPAGAPKEAGAAAIEI